MPRALDERRARRRRAVAAGLALALAFCVQLPGAIAQAQPAAESQRLNAALARLGQDPRNLEALIEAGVAALALGDVEAAIGFLRRADQISPGNPRVKAGLAGAMVRNENPFEAIALFTEAQRAGAIDVALAPDWGLAYDLVGDNATAQRYYQAALTSGAGVNDEARRRLALSQAIAGDRKGFEATLLPLIQRQDKAAWRVRTFALAIMGDAEDAVMIANTTMPREMATGLAPYLRYMPRLTRAQQAAAATFGHFPRAAEIGRDDPRIAAYSPGPTRRGADAGLVPAGEPLGRGARSRDQAARQTSRTRRPSATAATPKPAATVASAQPRVAPPEPQPQRAASPPPTPTVAAATAATPVVRPIAQPIAGTATPPAATQSPPVVVTSLTPPPSPIPVVVASIEPTPPPTVAAPPPQSLPPDMVVSLAPQAVEAGPPSAGPASPAPTSVPPPASIAAAFADLALPLTDATPAPGSVDISKIQPARPVVAKAPEPKPAAKPAPPAHPSRIWVQVATGRDKAALAFDWRKLSKDATEAFKNRKPYVSAWGQTNRLLTGPFESEKAANAFVALLRKEKLAPFLWTSPAGQVVDALPSR